jgi:hypothetical protein
MDTKGAKEDLVSQRLAAAIELAQLTEQSVFALTAKPRPDARFKTLFAGNDAELVRYFNHPPKLRAAGFSLEHDGNSRIVMGDLRRVLIQRWKILELWRDGTLIYAVDATVQPFWGSPRLDGAFRLNPLALAEPVYLFAELSRLVYEQSIQKPETVEYGVSFERVGTGDRPASLSEGPLDPTFFESGQRHPAPASCMHRAVTWEHEIDAGAVAYEIVQEVYHWFGISDDGIPYTKRNANGVPVIDRDALIRAGTGQAPLETPSRT